MIDLLFVLVLASITPTSVESELNDSIDVLLLEIQELQIIYDELVIAFDDTKIEAQKAWIEKEKLKIESEIMDKQDTMYEYQKSLYKQAKNDWNTAKNKHQQAENDLKELTTELDLVQTELEIVQRNLENFLKTKQNKATHQNVSITLSGTCERMIENGFSTQCPTYYELFMQYDNMNPSISGEFIGVENDIRRAPSNYSTHLGFYDSFPNWILVMVDPDTEFLTSGATANIEIQSREFQVTSPFGYKMPYDGTVRVFDNVKISADCKQVIIAPDIDLLDRVLVHIMSACTNELKLDSSYVNYRTHATINWWDSPALMYQDWLKKAKITYGNFMGDYIP